jgi:hypothetical protein
VTNGDVVIESIPKILNDFSRSQIQTQTLSLNCSSKELSQQDLENIEANEEAYLDDEDVIPLNEKLKDILIDDEDDYPTDAK